jgi:WNK lysine deficient protein kinase
MHSHSPAVIHRDLKCDNLFIDASEGIVKIGDFGLSRSISSGEEAESKLGTPAYTAPEVYTGKYTTKADLWSFGLCVLEMVTGETPYAECTNIGAIYMKVTTGGLPAALTKVGDPVIVDFITQCLLPAEARASAAHLLEHSLILGVDPEQMAIEPPIRTDDDEVIDFEEPLHVKEYADLVERQRGAMEKLLLDHKEQRIALRASIRQRVGRGG